MVKIIIRNKKRLIKAGLMRFTKLDQAIFLDINYRANPKFIIDLQKLLLKYYDLKLISGEGKIRNKFLLPKILESNKTKVAHKRMSH